MKTVLLSIRLFFSFPSLILSGIFYLQDLDTIQHIKQKALNDPESFISILRTGGDLGVPHRQVIAEVRHSANAFLLWPENNFD